MRNKISIGTLLSLMTGFVLLAAAYRASLTFPIVGAMLLFVESIVGVFVIFGVIFCVAYPFGRLDKFVAQQPSTNDSPFATDRLPSQILPPTDRGGE